jgi:hypothetical protein
MTSTSPVSAFTTKIDEGVVESSVKKYNAQIHPPEYFSGVAQSVTWAILNGHLLLILHTSLGLILVVNAAGLLLQAIRLRTRNLIVVTALKRSESWPRASTVAAI